MEKINVIRIVSNHLETLRLYRSQNLSKKDLALFYLVPMVVSATAIYAGYSLNDEVAGILLAAFAVLTGFLLNLLVFLYDMIQKSPSEKSEDPEINRINDLRKIILKETYFNISYCILVGLILTVFLVVGLISLRWVNCAASFIVFSLVGNFLLTLLMVLKRFNVLIQEKLD